MLALILGNTDGTNGRTAAGRTPIVGGLSLVERAVLAAQRAGVPRSVVVGTQDPGGSIAARLRARGADVAWARLGRQLKGAAQHINLGADIFLADTEGATSAASAATASATRASAASPSIAGGGRASTTTSRS